jgi:uncharacterized SAM-binding protein YcdF (DUF218 family)
VKRHRRRGGHVGGASIVVRSVLVLLLGWAAGFLWFLHAAHRTAPAPPQADGIVALTGGADRVETALRLLVADRAEWLLVSGIGPGTDLAGLGRRAGVDTAALVPRVYLGRQATSTRGNATETAVWVRAKEIHALIVVTAWYHMPRAMTELARAIPGVVLYPVPVEPEGSFRPGLAMARLLAEEYTKFLASRLDLTALRPERPPLETHSAHPG